MNIFGRGLLVTIGLLSSCVAWAQASPASTAQSSEDWKNSNPCPDWVRGESAGVGTGTGASSGGAESGTASLPSQRWDLTLSPYTLHWQSSPEHKPVVLGALDRQLPGNRLCGLSFFSNSFGQPSTYVYVGQRWDALLGNPNFFTKVSAGVLYGYVGKYKDKVPFNYKGFSPAIIPSIGYQLNPTDSAQLMVLGTAGLMFAYGHRF